MTRPIPTDLARVARAALDVELARLSAARAEEARLLEEVARLRAERSRLTSTEVSGDPAAVVRLAAWSAWCDDRIAAHLREIAARRAAREELMTGVRRAFGRKRAIELLIEREEVAARRRLDCL
jgi:hypothetical protein